MTDACFCDLAEFFRAFTVEPQGYFPTLIAIPGGGLCYTVTAEVGFLFDEQPFLSRFFISLRRMFVNFDVIIRRDHFFAFIDGFQALAVVRINKTELELGDARKLIARLLDFSRLEPGDLDKNTIHADRADNWFAASKEIDALADHLDRLVEHGFSDRLISTRQPDEK